MNQSTFRESNSRPPIQETIHLFCKLGGHKRNSLDPILSHINPVHIPIIYLLQMNSILSYHVSLNPEWFLFPSGFL
jgi:hypothetical protein